MKIGGKAKAGIVNQNLQEFQVKTQQHIQNSNCPEYTRKLMTDALLKIRGLKVKDGRKEEKESMPMLRIKRFKA